MPVSRTDIEKMISEELPHRGESYEVTGSRPLVILRLGDSGVRSSERPDPDPTLEVPVTEASPGGSARSLASIARRALARLKR
jgi:hypothetical protein